jgi:hypothetical protein
MTATQATILKLAILSVVVLSIGFVGGRTMASNTHGSSRHELIIPGHPQSLTVAWMPSMDAPLSTQQPIILSANDARVARLVSAVNDLPYIAGDGITSCPADDGSGYRLEFKYSDGDQWTVEMPTTGCRPVTAGGAWAYAYASDMVLGDIGAILPPGADIHNLGR